ncbi:hypothetical protein FNF29_08001 [Cafeteria roenbergensis]|uniref:Uncharacterized protein n=1 Tax=Cafeteria roenbergensis TaxID=33653 RepID=A0A5A8CZN9_CAFRO|nr:hypothetical protein FNF29_08001 [Cafeteria roenbergensis]KAA0158405.1 hypothetical protein FNF28_06233 [Cafeteria roenbergensis]|eukprot:KAA0146529.1 hypothetical protein FNF29_08001 [Cafeteria roenbergensis]
MSNAPVTGPPKDNPWDEDDTGGRSAVGAVAGAAGSAFTATAGAVGTASGALSNAIARTPLPWILWILRILNLTNGVLLGVAAFESFFILDGSVTRTFLMVYEACFGLLLVLFELRVGPVARWVKRQFGFMFTFAGRLAFLIFVGAVCFGMLHNRPPSLVMKSDIDSWEYSYSWVLGVGIGTMANALVNSFVVCSHPYFRSDPRAKMTDEEVERYLRNNPEAASRIAAKAGGPAGTPAAAAAKPAVPVRADFGASTAPSASGGYTPPAAMPAPEATPFTGSADGGVSEADVDPFTGSAPAPAPAAGPWSPAADDDDDDSTGDNPFA